MAWEKAAQSLLARADIAINGTRPTDIQLHVEPEQFFRRVIRDGHLGIGESFMENWWDAEDLTALVARFYRTGLADSLGHARRFAFAVQALLSYRQTRVRGEQVAKTHYDLGNDLFEYMLDKKLAMYTCGLYRDGATTIEEAQAAKCALSCRKLYLKPGDVVLDVGSGFTAGFLRFAVENYPDVRGVGIVNSEQQYELSRDRVRGLPIEIRLQDYREVDGEFDHIVSMGMLEHVGPGHYRKYFGKMRELLRDDGFMLAHWIGSPVAKWTCSPWFDKYIFPNGVAGSLSQMTRSVEGLFVCEDVDNFGADYDPTLQAWYDNLVEHWPKLEAKYGDMNDRVFRMMKFYLRGVAGDFRARTMELYQLVLSKSGVPGGYRSVR